MADINRAIDNLETDRDMRALVACLIDTLDQALQGLKPNDYCQSVRDRAAQKIWPPKGE